MNDITIIIMFNLTTIAPGEVIAVLALAVFILSGAAKILKQLHKFRK
jgi:hypothetical protein